MKRNDKANPLKKDASHVRLYDWMLDSAAWMDLTPVARSLYVLLKRKYNGTNNGSLILSARDAADKLRISKNTANKGLHELEDHGFVEVVIKGSFGGRKDGRASEYRLDERPCDLGNGEIPKKRFMRWRPDVNFRSPSAGTLSTSDRTVSTPGRTVKSA